MLIQAYPRFMCATFRFIVYIKISEYPGYVNPIFFFCADLTNILDFYLGLYRSLNLGFR